MGEGKQQLQSTETFFKMKHFQNELEKKIASQITISGKTGKIKKGRGVKTKTSKEFELKGDAMNGAEE